MESLDAADVVDTKATIVMTARIKAAGTNIKINTSCLETNMAWCCGNLNVLHASHNASRISTAHACYHNADGARKFEAKKQKHVHVHAPWK